MEEFAQVLVLRKWIQVIIKPGRMQKLHVGNKSMDERIAVDLVIQNVFEQGVTGWNSEGLSAAKFLDIRRGSRRFRREESRG